MVVSLQAEPALTLGTPHPLFDGTAVGVWLGAGYDVTADGKRFVMIQSLNPEAAGSGITVIENWYAEFK